MKKIILILFMFMILCGCGPNTQNKEVLNDDKLEKLILENEYVIVDVRTKEEYEEGHLVDAINIPYDEIDENIVLDKNKIIFVYCKSGNRSGIAYETLTNLGFEVYDLGGYTTIALPKE